MEINVSNVSMFQATQNPGGSDATQTHDFDVTQKPDFDVTQTHGGFEGVLIL